MRYELTDYEWIAIKPTLPNKWRGVRRVNDRRVLNGIFGVRSGQQSRFCLKPRYHATMSVSSATESFDRGSE